MLAWILFSKARDKMTQTAYFSVKVFALILGLSSITAGAVCEIVDGKKRLPFDGKSLDRILIDKRSLTTLNLEFPHLNAIERTFTGELQTCSVCIEKHIVCLDTP